MTQYHSFIHPSIPSPINTTVTHCTYFSSRSLFLSLCPLSTFTINSCRWLSSQFTVSQLMVSVFCTRTASWVQFRSVRRCLNPSHSVSYQKNNNYTFHKTFTIHHPSHTHYQSTDYTEIPKNMNIILYHSPLMHTISQRQKIYIYF